VAGEKIALPAAVDAGGRRREHVNSQIGWKAHVLAGPDSRRRIRPEVDQIRFYDIEIRQDDIEWSDKHLAVGLARKREKQLEQSADHQLMGRNRRTNHVQLSVVQLVPVAILRHALQVGEAHALLRQSLHSAHLSIVLIRHSIRVE
jgi:hypothetical protein